MNRALIAATVLAAHCVAAPSLAQPPRKDAIWARSTAGAPITLNGVLSEAAWASAESVVVRYGIDAGIPGSGWKPEAGINPSDSTHATLKFLTHGDYLYMGAVMRDKSVGGSRDFNRFDGLLMAIKDHLDPYRPAPPAEYLYSWWFPERTPPSDTAPGLSPGFRGRWTRCNAPDNDCTLPRTPEMIDNWDAVTTVHGISNDDNNVDGNPSDDNDAGYTVEMKFKLSAVGYDILDADGDVVEFNVSIYDCDWLWPFQGIFSANRVWLQGPWGNAFWYHNLRIHARPSVTVSSGPAPAIGPEIRIPNGATFAAPVIDGSLADAAWGAAPRLDIRYGDDALRASYPGVGPFRSGQYQPPVNGGQAFILDPGDATVRWFFRGNLLYLGFDVRDQVVQYVANNYDRWDGFTVTLNEYSLRGPDRQLLGRRLSFQVGPGGGAVAHDYLPYLRDTVGGAFLGLQLKPGTTVDTLGQSPDQGYTAELAIDLTKLGYPSGLGDGRLFLGISLLDGDSYTPFTDSYGTRTWWQREYEGQDGPAWCYLDPSLPLADVGDRPLARGIELLGNAPNPFRHHMAIRYRADRTLRAAIEVFDLQGRLIATREFGPQPPGTRSLTYRRDPALASGLYLYRLRLTEESTGAATALPGKMIVMQ